jgi:hypothetical protein
MARVAPIYSAKLIDRKHHNNDQCTERNNIERVNVRLGTGNLPLCARCHDLNLRGL